MSIVHKLLMLLVASAIVCASYQMGEIDDDNKTKLEHSYCFRFTWLGPKFNEESQFKNATCSDVIRGDKSVPCTHPLVVTNNSNIPDTEYIWNEYPNTQIACRMVLGEVCAKFSYSFNGAVENITYLCTKVNVENETAVSNGCFTQMKNGHEMELCICESRVGEIPCNGATNTNLFSYICSVIILVLLAITIK